MKSRDFTIKLVALLACLSIGLVWFIAEANASSDIPRVGDIPKILSEEVDDSLGRIIARVSRISDHKAFDGLEVSSNGEISSVEGFEWGGGWPYYTSSSDIDSLVIQRAGGDMFEIFDKLRGWIFVLYKDGEPIASFVMQEAEPNPAFVYIHYSSIANCSTVIDAVEALRNYSARTSVSDIAFVGIPTSICSVAVDVSQKRQYCVVVARESEYHNEVENPNTGNVLPASDFIGWYQQRDMTTPLIDDFSSLNYKAIISFAPVSSQAYIDNEVTPTNTHWYIYGLIIVLTVVGILAVMIYVRRRKRL